MAKEILPTKNGGQHSPFLMHPFEALHQDMDRLFDRYVPSRLTQWLSEDDDMSNFAQMDVVESEGAIDIKIDVPGVDEDDIDVTLSDNMLTIRGKRESSSDEKKENFHRVERSFGSFVRRIELPTEIDTGKIEASIKKGVLGLHLVKSAKAKSKERKIKVKSV